MREHSTDKLTYRHKLHVPLGWRLQQHSKRKKKQTTTTTTTTTKKYLLVRLVSNAISNTRKDKPAVIPKIENLNVIESARKTAHTTQVIVKLYYMQHDI